MNLCLFFEGTGQGVAGKVTNVTRLRDVCAEDANQRLHLEPGPGTRFGSYVRGSLAGVDWQDVFRGARRWFEGNYMSLPSDDVSTRVFLFGFSRGALIARHFAEWLDKLGIPVAYLGLWDTVDSTIGLDVSETCPSNVRHARHAVARDETRRFFQYVPLKSCGKGEVMEMVFPGCHSDVGGLYDDNHLMADLALAWVATGARKAGLRIRKGERIVQRLDKSAVVLHDSHALVSNLWGAFGRIKRDLRGLRLHRLCRHLVASFVILATLAIAPCLAPTAQADANPAGCAQPAPRTILIHSHNDYAQKRPFWGAYEAGADSIEADVFLVDGELIVAHSKRNLKPENTLRRLYLEPLRGVFRKNGGRVRANGKPLQLLVDLKNGKPAFDALVALIEREGFRDCFDICKNPAAARLTITGDNSAIDFSACPAFVFFDVPSNRKLDAGQYKRVWLVSDYARIYTKWRSGEMKEGDKRKIREAAAQAHAKGVLFRLWGFPDHVDAWRLSLELGLDYINTDRPSAAVKHQTERKQCK